MDTSLEVKNCILVAVDSATWFIPSRASLVLALFLACSAAAPAMLSSAVAALSRPCTISSISKPALEALEALSTVCLAVSSTASRLLCAAS